MASQRLRDLGMDAGGGEVADVLVPERVEIVDPASGVAEGQYRGLLPNLLLVGRRCLLDPGLARGGEGGLYAAIDAVLVAVSGPTTSSISS
jgi:hypothetical protein